MHSSHGTLRFFLSLVVPLLFITNIVSFGKAIVYSKNVEYQSETLSASPFHISFHQIYTSTLHPEIIYILSNPYFIYKFNQTNGDRKALAGCTNTCFGIQDFQTKQQHPATQTSIYLIAFHVDERREIIYLASYSQIYCLDVRDGNITLLSKTFSTVEMGSLVEDGMNLGNTTFSSISAITTDSSGNLYVSETRIYKVGLDGIVRYVTGPNSIGQKNDGYANQTSLMATQKLIYQDGYLYGYDMFSIFNINLETGWLKIILGRSLIGSSSDGPAIDAKLLSISGMSVMDDGSIILIHRGLLRFVNNSDGMLSTLRSFDVSITSELALFSPTCIYNTKSIFKMDRSTWAVSPVLDAVLGALGDGVLIKNRMYNSISAMALNVSSNELLLVDSTSNYNIQKIDLSKGTVSTLSLSDKLSNASCWNSSVTIENSFTFNPVSIQIKDSNLYLANTGMKSSIQKIDFSGGSTCFYGGSISSERLLKKGLPKSIIMNNPTGLHCPSIDLVYIADTNNHRILRYSSSFVEVIAGNGLAGFSGDGGLAINAQLDRPHSVYFEKSDESIYIADSGNNRIRIISSNGTISTIVGNGIGGFNGDGLHALNTQLNFPKYIVNSPFGLFISDTSNNRIRRLMNQTVTTILGSGNSGSKIEETKPLSTEINSPFGLFFQQSQTLSILYIADSYNHRILSLTLSTSSEWIVSIVAGTNVPGYNGDGMNPTQASLFLPSSVSFSTDGLTLYIADTYNNRIRKISNGVISTMAPRTLDAKIPIGLCGTISRGTSSVLVTSQNVIYLVSDFSYDITIGGNGDGLNIFNADVNPTKMLLTNDGQMLISESNTNRIRLVDNNGIITTIAGTGQFGFGGDDEKSVHSILASPAGLSYSPNSNDLYFCDSSNNRVRKIDSNSFISTIAGTGEAGKTYYESDPLLSKLDNPRIISFLSNGDAVIGDTLNSMIKIISKRDGKIRLVSTNSLATDMVITKHNEILISTNNQLLKLTPYCKDGYELVRNNTDCIPICFGLSKSGMCSGNGACISPNGCLCNDGYTGMQCEIPICFGISANESIVCSNRNGSCVSTDNCVCNDGFYGEKCQNAICFSKLIGESCGGPNRGNCVHKDTCSCAQDFTGERCELRSCFGKSETDPKSCNGNGKCGAEGKCQCKLGYSGDECSDMAQIYALSIIAALIVFILSVLMIVSFIMGIFLYRKNKRDRKILETELSLDQKLLSTTDAYDIQEISTLSSSQHPSGEDDTSSFVIPLSKLGMDKPIRRLGEGGMGAVFQTKYNGMIVAVKVFDLNNFNISEEDFRNEAILLSKIRHPNIITFYGVSSSPTKRYIVMECLEHSMDKVIAKLEMKQLNLSLDRKMKMLLNIGNGIEYLHSMKPRKIIHRDLKPQNILQDVNGNCKVCDFGLSKSISQGTMSALTNQLGTHFYMSPEIFDIQSIDPKYATAVDIYSFSIIMWQLIFEIKDPYLNKSQQILNKLKTKPLEQITSYQLTKLICENNHRPSIPFNSLESCHEWCCEFMPSDQSNSSIIFKVCQLIQQCWEGEAKFRPNIEQILEQLQSFEEDLLNKQ